MRVVSLLPSATEILCAIEGGETLLVGRSHECDFPKSIGVLPVLTGQRTHAASSREIDRQVREAAGESLYTLDTDALRELKPDVILTQDLCDVCSVDLDTVRTVAAELTPSPRIISLDPGTIEDVFEDVLSVGEAVGLVEAARETVVALRDRYWTAVDYVNPYLDGPEVAFLEWMDPLFTAGHWTPQLIRAAGGRHSLNEPGRKSRQIEPEELLAVMPDRLIICPCGYDLDAVERELGTLTSQRWWKLLPAVQDGQVALVDGSSMFNRPGPRLVEAFRWLVGWLNDRRELIPERFPSKHGWDEQRTDRSEHHHRSQR